MLEGISQASFIFISQISSFRLSSRQLVILEGQEILFDVLDKFRYFSFSLLLLRDITTLLMLVVCIQSLSVMLFDFLVKVCINYYPIMELLIALPQKDHQKASWLKEQSYNSKFLIQGYHSKSRTNNYYQSSHISYMLQQKYQPSYGCVAKSIHSSLKQTINQRLTIQPNRIFLTDFSNTNFRYEMKKKCCPLFLLNKSHKKKKQQNHSMFTNQGILQQHKFYNQRPTVFEDQKPRPTSHMRSSSFGTKKLQPRSAYNFTRKITPVKATISHQVNANPIFCLYPQGRILKSSQSDREKYLPNKKSRKSYTNTQSRLKTEGNEQKNKQFAGWQTIDVEFDELM